MSFKNFLDLRKKTPPQIKIVERIILQKRSVKSDLFLTLSVILVASAVIWGISKADSLSDFFDSSQTPAKSFSMTGKVTEITDKSISVDSGIKKEVDKSVVNLVDKVVEATTTEEVVGSTTDTTSSSSTADDIVEDATTTSSENLGEENSNNSTLSQEATSSDESQATTTDGIINKIIESASDAIENVVNIFTPTTSAEETPSPNTTDTFDITKISSIQTNHFAQLSISDIKLGDNVILQGVERGGVVTIYRIYSYGTEIATGILTEEVAATTTIAMATTTDEIATTTASSTEELNASSTASSTPATFIDIMRDALGNMMDALTGTIASSTEATSTDEVGTTTESDGTSTQQVPTESSSDISESPSPSIIDTVVDTAKSAVEKVVEVFTGNKEEPAPADTAPTTPPPAIPETPSIPAPDVTPATN